MDAAVNFPTTPQAVKASALTLNKRMNVEQAFDVIVRSCIEQVRANANGVVRAALAMFGALMPAPIDINDGAVAARLLGELCDANEPLREGAALANGYLAAAGEYGVPKVRKLWKKLAPLAAPH